MQYHIINKLLSFYYPIIKETLGINSKVILCVTSDENIKFRKENGFKFGTCGHHDANTSHIFIYLHSISVHTLMKYWMFSSRDIYKIICLRAIETLAHELRHVWQKNHWTTFNNNTAQLSGTEYINSPEEVDAREYANKFMLSLKDSFQNVYDQIERGEIA
jgi:hypothetical protein